MAITFVENVKITVKLDGKVVGEIKNTTILGKTYYQYRHKGSKSGGESFNTLEACKKSLIEE